MSKGYLTPAEITDYTIKAGVTKVERKNIEVLLMAILAGMYIAMGALAASTASHAIANSGLAKLVAGAVFPIGLMFVVLNGADLFTGNCLIFMGVMDKKIRFRDFIKNLMIVLIGNSIGAIALGWMQVYGGMLNMSNGGFGAYIITTAVSKVNINFSQALVLAVMCNIFVCAGVWMVYASTDVSGKILASFFSIVAFVISGSEHIVANMYYIPAAMFAKSNAAFIELAGVTPDQLSNLTWKGFFLNNIIPVTIGNIIGGMIISAFYYIIYKKLNQSQKKPRIVTTKNKVA
mgnify:CR=1 FL=1